MGTSFGNLSIQGAELAAIEALYPNFEVRSILPGWITVVSEELEWGTVQKEARRISKAVTHPVLATEYFDDDYAEFSLYVGGRRVARHVPAAYEDIARVPGKSKAWAEQLGLPKETEKILQTIFKEENAEASLRLLECVLHCPLWVHAAWIDETAEPTPEYLTEYLQRKQAEKKIKNQTKLVLLDEVSGEFSLKTYPVVCECKIKEFAAEDFKKEGLARVFESQAMSFWDIKDGKLRKLFESDAMRDVCRSYGLDREVDAVLLSFVQERPTERHLYVFSENGELFAFHKDGFVGYHGVFLDRERVFLSGKCWKIRTDTIEWDLGLEQAVYGARPFCRLENGRVAVVVDLGGKSKRSHLISIYPDGSERCDLELPDYRHWCYPVAWRDGFLMGYGNLLTANDPWLKPLWSIELQETADQFTKPVLDAQTNILYIPSYGSIIAVDLEKREIKAIRRISYSEHCYFQGVLPGIGPIMLTGDASIQVWNAELMPISKHRTKGYYGKLVSQDGKLYVLSGTEQKDEIRNTTTGWERVVLKEGCIRLYELKA